MIKAKDLILLLVLKYFGLILSVNSLGLLVRYATLFQYDIYGKF